VSDSPKIFALIAQAIGKVGFVGKERKNQQQGYSFRGIDDVLAAVQPVFAELGIVPAPRVIEREREEFKTAKGSSMFSVRLLVEHRFYAPDGSFIEVTTLGEAMDTGDKSSNKAMSQAFKYALIEMLAIPTYERDRDTEDASPEVAGRAEHRPPQQQERRPPPNAPTADEVEAVMAEIALAKSTADLEKKCLPDVRRITGQNKDHALRVAFSKRWRELTPPAEQQQRGAA
jgi:hypothetical protein